MEGQKKKQLKFKWLILNSLEGNSEFKPALLQ